MLKQIGEEGPKVFAEVLSKLKGVNYFVFSGTALGLYRDGDLIPTDNDIDFVIKKEESSIADLKIRLSGYAVHWQSDRQITFIHPKGIIVDFLFLYKFDEGWEIQAPHYWSVKSECFNSVTIKETKYGLVRFPVNVESIFLKKYGKDWRTPKFQQKARWVNG